MKLTPLPSTISTAYCALKWPKLEPLTLKPLAYQSVETLLAYGLDSENDVFRTLAEDIPSRLNDDLGGSDYARVALGLLLMGTSSGSLGADLCHDLVLPLSWADDLGMGYGPVVMNSDAKFEASYAHALVHRFEGPNIGELGMLGWSNANYWSRAANSVNSQDDNARMLFKRTMKYHMVHLAQQMNEQDQNDSIMVWFNDHLGTSEQDKCFWEPRAIHQLCTEVVSGKQSISPCLKKFAQKAAEKELEVLISHCLVKAGYDAVLTKD